MKTFNADRNYILETMKQINAVPKKYLKKHLGSSKPSVAAKTEHFYKRWEEYEFEAEMMNSDVVRKLSASRKRKLIRETLVDQGFIEMLDYQFFVGKFRCTQECYEVMILIAPCTLDFKKRDLFV